MGALEAPAGKKAGKVPRRKIDPNALKHDVKAFASQLGLVSGGDDSFGDFAPSKAKQRIAPGSKPNKRQRLNDDTPTKIHGIGKAPAAQGQQPPAQKEAGPGKVQGQAGKKKDKDPHASQLGRSGKQRDGKSFGSKSELAHGGGVDEQPAAGEAKGREWNFGVGPRPGEAKGFKSLLGKAEGSIWYRTAAALSDAAAAAAPPPAAAAAASAPEVDPDLFERRRAAAEALMETEATAFEKELQKRNLSDAKWLQQVRRGGTSTDKLAAATLLVQESVVANMKALDQLVSLATKRSGGKELVRQAMEALQELFTNVLLPNRKLRFLEQQPLQDLPAGRDGEKLLLLWWTEDCIKRRYAMFVAALEEHSKDNLEFLKEKSMRVMGELLSAKPECEARLLSALVNKLGDPSRQVASKAVYLLMQLLASHPVMKPVVVREVERFVFRPGLADKARYYSIVFLNQVPLSHRGSEGGDALAQQLISLYFTLFRMVVEGHIGTAAQLRKQQEEKYAEEKKKFWREQRKAEAASGQRGGRRGRGGRDGRGAGRGKSARPPPPPKPAAAEEVDARLLSGLITGVRRAFPYVKPEDVEPLVEQSAGQMFRLVHTAPFTVAVQALMLMYQLMAARAAISDRYYRALYAALDRDGPTTSSRAPMFLALLFKAMQGDVSVKRVAAFAKRLLQLAVAAQPHWACGALMLISQVLSTQPALWAAITHPEDVSGSGVEEFKDPDDDDDDVERFRDHDGSDDEGAEKKREKGKKAAAAGRKSKAAEDDGVAKAEADGDRKASESEDEEDGDDDDNGELAGFKLDMNGARRRTHELASTSGRGSLAAKAAAAQAQARAAEAAATSWPQPSYYQMDKREPLYANADRSCWWELTALAAHAHPSVSAMARSLLCGAPVVFDGDPLRDLSLAAFLDKFVNKKPKPVARGASVMQPTTAVLGGVLGASGGRAAKSQQPASLTQLSSEAFAALAEAQVESADLFFHKFLNLKGVKDKRAARVDAKARAKRKEDGEEHRDGGADGGDESLSEADDDEVDRYLEKQEGMADDGLGDPDMGYDYEQLAAAMEDGGLSDSEELQEGDEDDDEGEDEDGGSLDDVNILDLPSPSADDEAEEESDEEAAAARRKRHREAMEAAGVTEADIQTLSDDGDDDDYEEGDAGEELGDDEEVPTDDGEDELMRLMAGGSDEDDGDGEDVDMEVLDGGSGSGSEADEEDDEEVPQLVSPGGGGKKGKAAGRNAPKGDKKDKKGGGGKGGGSLFASADDYEALIERAEREEGRGGLKGRDGHGGRGRKRGAHGRGRGGQGGRAWRGRSGGRARGGRRT